MALLVSARPPSNPTPPSPGSGTIQPRHRTPNSRCHGPSKFTSCQQCEPEPERARREHTAEATASWKRHHRHRHVSAQRAPTAPRSTWAMRRNGQSNTVPSGRSGLEDRRGVLAVKGAVRHGGIDGRIDRPSLTERRGAARGQHTATRLRSQAKIVPGALVDASARVAGREVGAMPGAPFPRRG